MKIRVVRISEGERDMKGIYFSKDFDADSADFLDNEFNAIESDETFNIEPSDKITFDKIFKQTLI